MNAEKRRFQMHPKLLLDVIQRQAGSLAKAIMEGAMNAVDAKSTKFEVTVEEKSVYMKDDGQGITQRSDIERWFEVFGQPHEESEGKIYGTFRMGRGQAFAFGKNVWRTGPFQMEIDIKTDGLDYHLTEKKTSTKGCEISIQLYAPLSPGDLHNTITTISKWLKYAPIDCFINGNKVNVDPESEDWTQVTDEAYMRVSDTSGSMMIYNLGVHTMDLSGYQLGASGVVVSKKQLKVNFARNDIQSDCPVWKKIKPLISRLADRKIKSKMTLNDDQRLNLLQRMIAGGEEMPADAENKKVFTAVSGRHYSAMQIAKLLLSYGYKVSVCAEGHRIGDKLFQQKAAFIFSRSMLGATGKSLTGLMKLIKKLIPENDYFYEHFDKYQEVDFKDLSAGLNEDYELLETNKLNITDKIWKEMADVMLRRLASKAGMDWAAANAARRAIFIGESDVADGWTDGTSYVAISRRLVRQLPMSVVGIIKLGVLLLHELCHDNNDQATHVHGLDFYEKFHDDGTACLHDCIYSGLVELPKLLKKYNRKLSKTTLKTQDQVWRVQNEVEQLFDKSKTLKLSVDPERVPEPAAVA